MAGASLAAVEESSAEQVLRDILLSGKAAVKAGRECIDWNVEVSANDASELGGKLTRAWTQRGISVKQERDFAVREGALFRSSVREEVRRPDGTGYEGSDLCGFEMSNLSNAGPGCVSVARGDRSEETWCSDLERCNRDGLLLAKDGCGQPSTRVSLAD